MKFFKTVLTIFVAILLALFALSVVIKHNPRDSGKESVSESEQYSESKMSGGETGSEKESEKGSVPGAGTGHGSQPDDRCFRQRRK